MRHSVTALPKGYISEKQDLSHFSNLSPTSVLDNKTRNNTTQGGSRFIKTSQNKMFSNSYNIFPMTPPEKSNKQADIQSGFKGQGHNPFAQTSNNFNTGNLFSRENSKEPVSPGIFSGSNVPFIALSTKPAQGSLQTMVTATPKSQSDGRSQKHTSITNNINLQPIDQGSKQRDFETTFRSSNSQVRFDSRNNCAQKDQEKLKKFLSIRKSKKNDISILTTPGKGPVEQLLSCQQTPTFKSRKRTLPSLTPTSTAECQQSIIKKLKMQQRLKNQIDLSPENLSTYGKSSSQIIEQDVQNQPQMVNGTQFGQAKEYKPRSVKHTFFEQPHDFGVNNQEVSELGNIRDDEPKDFDKSDNSLNVNVLECWLNDTLKDAEHFEIPGTIRKRQNGIGPSGGGKQSHCIDYGIDRLTLNNTGISNVIINQLYRSMFVNTMGFFNQLNTLINAQADQIKMRFGQGQGMNQTTPAEEMITQQREGQKKHQTKASLLTAFWRVYAILLEHTYSADYKLQICELMEDNNLKEESVNKQFNIKLAEKDVQMKQLRKTIGDMIKKQTSTEEELKAAMGEIKKLSQEKIKQNEIHEEEVALRQKIESRLNQLHSLNRTLELKAIDLANKLQEKTEECNIVTDNFDLSQLTLKNVRIERSDLQQWKGHASSKLDLKDTTIENLKDQLKDELDNREKQKGQLMQNNREIRDLRLESKKQKEDIETLQVENKQLSKQCKRNKKMANSNTQELKDTHRENEENQDKVQALINQKAQIAKNYQASDQNRKKLKEQNKQLFDENTNFNEKSIQLEIDLKCSQDQLVITQEQLKIYTGNFEDSVQKITDFSEERIYLLKEIRHLKDVKEVQELKIIDLTNIETSLTDKNHKLEHELIQENERFNDMKKQYTACRLQYDALKKNTDERISYLSKALDIIQKKLIFTETELEGEIVKLQVANEKLNMVRQTNTQQANIIQLQKCDIDTKNNEISTLNKRIKKLGEANNQALSNYDKMRANWQTALQTQNFYQDDKDKCLKQQQEEFDEVLKQVDRDKMVEEDYLAHHVRAHEELMILRTENKEMSETLAIQKEKIDNFDKKMAQVYHESDEVRNQNSQQLIQIHELNTKIVKFEKQVEGLRKNIEDLKAEVEKNKKYIDSQDNQIIDLIKAGKKKAEEIYALKNKPKADKECQFPLLTHWPYNEIPPAPVKQEGDGFTQTFDQRRQGSQNTIPEVPGDAGTIDGGSSPEDTQGKVKEVLDPILDEAVKEEAATPVETELETYQGYIDIDCNVYSESFIETMKSYANQVCKIHTEVSQFAYIERTKELGVQCEILVEQDSIIQNSSIQSTVKKQVHQEDDDGMNTQDSGTLGGEGQDDTEFERGGKDDSDKASTNHLISQAFNMKSFNKDIDEPSLDKNKSQKKKGPANKLKDNTTVSQEICCDCHCHKEAFHQYSQPSPTPLASQTRSQLSSQQRNERQHEQNFQLPQQQEKSGKKGDLQNRFKNELKNKLKKDIDTKGQLSDSTVEGPPPSPSKIKKQQSTGPKKKQTIKTQKGNAPSNNATPLGERPLVETRNDDLFHLKNNTYDHTYEDEQQFGQMSLDDHGLLGFDHRENTELFEESQSTAKLANREKIDHSKYITEFDSSKDRYKEEDSIYDQDQKGSPHSFQLGSSRNPTQVQIMTSRGGVYQQDFNQQRKLIELGKQDKETEPMSPARKGMKILGKPNIKKLIKGAYTRD